MRHPRCALIFLALLSLGLPQWTAGQNPPGWLGDSPPGGGVSQLAADGGDANRLYAAAGFLYLSRNRGTTWQVAAVPESGFDAVATAPSRPGRLYAFDRNTLLRSDDGAASLQPVATSQQFASPRHLIVDPHDADRLYVYAGNDIGLLRSDDAGVNWLAINPAPQIDLQDLAIAPEDSGGLLAVNSEGAWRSQNRGDSWELSLSLFDEDRRINAVDFLTDQDIIAAGTHVWISSDGGRTWRQTDNPSEAPILGLEAAGPDGRVYAFAFFSQVWSSDDGGRTWQQTSRGLEHRRITGLLADPRNPSVVHAATEFGGVFITRDGGQRWHLNSQGLKPTVNQVLQLDSGAFIAAAQAGLFLRRPGDARWTRRGGTAGAAQALGLARTERGLYAGMSRGLLFSPDQGESWQSLELPEAVPGCLDVDARGDSGASVVFCITQGRELLRIRHSGPQVTARFLTLPHPGPLKVAVDPHEPRRVYLATLVQAMFATQFGGLFVSDNDGQDWRRLSDPDFRGVFGVAVSAHHPGRVLAYESDDILISDDGGESFRLSTLPRDDRNHPVTALAIDPRDRDTFYAASFLDLFVTRDGGQTFARHPASPVPGSIQDISFSADDPITLLAATRAGVLKLALEEDVSRIPLAFGGTATQQVTNSQLLLYNASPNASLSADVTFLNEEGRLARQRVNIPARGMRQLPTAAGFASGWVDARPAEDSPTPAQDEGESALGALNFLTAGHSVAAAAAERLKQSFVLPLLDGKIEDASTLLALANPGNLPRGVQLELRNPDSGRRAQAEVEVPAGGQLLLGLSDIEWTFAAGLDADLENFVGYLEGHAAPAPVLATGLLQVNDDLATLTTAQAATPPVLRDASAGPAPIIFPQFGHGEANGARLTARLALFNPAPLPAAAQVEFLDLDGNPLPTALNGDSPSGRSNLTLAARSLTLLEAPMSEAGRLDFGWLRVQSARPLDGWLILQGNLGTAVLRGQPQPEARPEATARQIFLPVLNGSAPFLSTGFALANPGAQEAVVDLLLHNADGFLLATSQLVLPPASQRGAFLPEIDWQPQPNTPLPPLDEFQGLVVISSTDPVAASLLHLRPGHFALLPLP